MAWIILLVAGLLETVWAFFMKQSEGFTRPVASLITLVAMVASFALLAKAMKLLPLGTAYTVWTGIGAVGAVVLGVMFLGESLSPLRLIALALIISGIVLLRVSTVQ